MNADAAFLVIESEVVSLIHQAIRNNPTLPLWNVMPAPSTPWKDSQKNHYTLTEGIGRGFHDTEHIEHLHTDILYQQKGYPSSR